MNTIKNFFETKFRRKNKRKKFTNINQIPKGLKYKDVPPFIPDIKGGRVIKVYDADTITIATCLYGDIYRFNVRLLGIDTPEIKTNNEIEKKMAILARDKLALYIYQNVIKLNNISYDKYGRILANVICDGKSVNNWLIENRYAVKYDGGKKISPSNWEQYYKYGKM